MAEVVENAKTENAPVSQDKLDILDQLLKPEVQESLNTLVEQLPKLTEMVSFLTTSFDFVQKVATDEILKSDTIGAIKEIAEPVKETAKNVAATVIEAKDRAEVSNETIGLFGLLRLLKDPQAQKLFRFVDAYLKVSAEKSNN
ncbi:DUF1641 domain-containing protein [Heyndrickxia camelliae]|uniref:DUF1641 domain-containing protein n=1 Tax=Heyndrickxia camelliae TaxID=1707093 RepID=A0A2N3LQ91_9BACI|nr:DUF1641 domain-containing protein [Heyndrickxia camelliae]PKR86780.1 hypothetical protein CWO92_01590 [Heyndrickxia camelliae]